MPHETITAQPHRLQRLFSRKAALAETLLDELSAAGKPQITVGIGLDTGDVVAGHVGSERRLEFTLIGVPVNNSSYLSKVRPAKTVAMRLAALLSSSSKVRTNRLLWVLAHCT